MYTVIVDNLQVYAYHGVSPEERKIGHRYEIDLTMEVEGKADDDDDIEHTVHYGLAAEIAENTVKESQYKTVEKLAKVVGRNLLKRFSQIQSVEVSIRKPFPPAPIIADSVGVVVTVSR